jgi:hypothetical protein
MADQANAFREEMSQLTQSLHPLSFTQVPYKDSTYLE